MLLIDRERLSFIHLKKVIHMVGCRKKYTIWFVADIEKLHEEGLAIQDIADFYDLVELTKSNTVVHIVQHFDIEEESKGAVKRTVQPPPSTKKPRSTGSCKVKGGNTSMHSWGSVEPAPCVRKIPGMGCAVRQFATLLSNLTVKQKMWVVDMGFEELLFMRIGNIDARFGYGITCRFDPNTLELEIRDNYKVKIDEELVGLVLGLRSGHHLLFPSYSNKSTALNNKKLYKQNTMYGAITESEVYGKIVSEPQDKETFQKHFLLYALGTILRPTQKRGWISPLHASVLYLASESADYNWARYVLDWLVKYGKKFNSSKEGYGGCTLLLLIIYIDRLTSTRVNLNIIPNSCRLRVLDQESVDRVLKSDQGPNGDYGYGEVVEDYVYGDM
ncbi:uncharacterized protein [Spinacia oleracea]|uniref:Uncharacterized protein isoform X1 n=1 Tax=Spinacia oleracea TaxID=3562 RepID=A0ABM3QLI8_SPIOL|nr:uncharacterized protein LOC110783600 isoform X1 [Spinacia oleracea]